MPGKYYTSARFALLFLFLVVLLLLRKPDLLASPQLYAEDATVFFRDQLVTPRIAVFLPYNGQFHLVPRLIALLETLLPIGAYAVFCSLASVLVQALCLGIFFMPWNRWLIPNDLLRAAVCVIMATALEGAEMIGFSGPLMWYLFLAGVLLLFRPQPAEPSPRRRWLSLASMFVIALSAAPLVTLGPAALWLAVKARGERRFVALAMLAGLFVQSFGLAFSARSDQRAIATKGILMLGWKLGTAVVVSWIYPGLITPLAGKSAAIFISQYPSIGPALCIVIVLSVLLTWMLTTAAPKERLRLVIAIYIALSTIASVLYTRNLIPFSEILTGHAPLLPPRYFVLAGALLLYIACLLIERLPLRDPRLQAGCLIVLFASGIYHNFSQPPYDPQFVWKNIVPRVEQWRMARAQGQSTPSAVLVAPAPWTIYLP